MMHALIVVTQAKKLMKFKPIFIKIVSKRFQPVLFDSFLNTNKPWHAF